MPASHLDAAGDVTNHLFTFSPTSALPQALRLARCQAAHFVDRSVDELPSENVVMNRGILHGEASILALNAKVVISLENLFSWRHKDRMSRDSQLSHAESLRFRRALYRIWLLSYLYGMGSIPDTMGANDYNEFDLVKCISKQKAFLSKFTTADLHEIKRVAFFLQAIALWAIGVDGSCLDTLEVYDYNGLYQFAGPRAILECYEEATVEPLPFNLLGDGGLYSKFLLGPLAEILNERGDVAMRGPTFNHVILDHIIGQDDKCQYCGSDDILGMPQCLYNETNWDFMKGLLLSDLSFCVKGGLLRNQVESSPLRHYLKSMDYSALFHEMFASKQGAYNDWSPEKWACPSCLSEFFRNTLPFAWLDRKRRAGERIMKSCRYGYDCHKQERDTGLRHAQQFNHLCEPSCVESEAPRNRHL